MAVSVPSLYVTKIIGAGSGTAATSDDSSPYHGPMVRIASGRRGETHSDEEAG